MRIPKIVLLAAVAALLAVATAMPASAQQPDPEFVAEPAPDSQTRGEGYFVIAAEPGERVSQAVYLRNDSSRPLTLNLSAVDATTGPVGGASYELPNDPRDAVGAWIALERTSITLGAGKGAEVPFELEVPSDATTGEHLGGIAVWAPAKEENVEAAPAGEAGASVSFQTRRIIAVQVNLPGPAEPLLVITGVTPAARPDGVYLEIGIENQGDALTKGEGTITLPDEGFERDFSIDTFVPATAIAYPIQWTVAADNGTYAAAVEISYDGKTATWNGEFTLGEAVQDELAQRQTNRPPRDWLPIITMAAFALALGAVLLLLRERRRSAPAAPVGVAAGGGPASRRVPRPRWKRGAAPVATARPASVPIDPRFPAAQPPPRRGQLSSPPPPPPPPYAGAAPARSAPTGARAPQRHAYAAPPPPPPPPATT